MQLSTWGKGAGVLFLAGTFLGTACLPEIQAGIKSESEVKLTASAGKLDDSGKQEVTIVMNINKGWHAYANPVGNSTLRPAQTTVKIRAKVEPKQVKVTYPPGKLVEDKAVGDHKVYHGKVVMKAMVQRAPGDTSPLEVSVTFMTCHDVEMKCLLPSTVKLTVK